MSDMSEFTTGPLTIQEMIKIISLLENPEEAWGVRRALRFYEAPDRPWTWGENELARKTLMHYANPQDKWELDQVLNLLKTRKCSSLLEIGSSVGGSLARMAAVMPKGSQIVSVDLPIDETPKYLNPLDSLKETCRQISRLGATVNLFIGDSHSQKVVDAVSNLGPFDFIFIDGDHSYDGMKADWANYGPMGKIVAFHDIAGPLEDCRRAWAEIKAEGYATEEFVSPTRKYGIGVVYRG